MNRRAPRTRTNTPRCSGTCSSTGSTSRRRSSRRCSSRSRTRKRTSTERWRPSLTSSATELWSTIVDEAGDAWQDALRADADRAPVFSPLCDERFALGLETIYEGYLCHYGRPRLFAPVDDEAALLIGDYLYAHGLVRIAATGEVKAVAELAELISLCARVRAEGEDGDGEAWLASVASLGRMPPDDETVERSLTAHRGRVS